MRNILIIIFNTIFLVGIAGGISFLVVYALDVKEVSDCETYRARAHKLESYYITKWQKEMCDRHNITIEAPVR